ncbi:uncharacterized protein LOC131942337 [Physella acuta]|uniref:uncharacterized protein LOC131942337 n=1 Tax=Physella acuta TaxID=109671 RepID=UPI0027DD542A|nr:uncharacterized protein LOC131942337 [Physella acuta]
MTQTYQVIEENQRILLNLLSNILGKTPYVMLMDIPSHKNKGDSAITVGEVMIIKKLRKRILFYCETYDCAQDRYLERAISISKKFSVNEIAILLHGGGNLVGYDSIDVLREKILNTFPEHKIVLLSQSIWLHDNYTEHLEFCSQVYSNRSNLSIFLRDKQSLAIAQENFKDVKLFLAPDMAFGIGHVPRILPPYFDIVWLRRNDRESSKYEIPSFPRGVSIHISDWRSAWPSNEGKTDLDNAFNIAHAGFSFLQRGRIVITDRLHGHILSVLMDIPHVLIDNPPFYKLSSFDQTWTEGLENTVLVTNGSNALQEALLLLAKYNHTLPEIGPSDMHVNGIEISSFNKLI